MGGGQNTSFNNSSSTALSVTGVVELVSCYREDRGGGSGARPAAGGEAGRVADTGASLELDRLRPGDENESDI